MPRRRCSDGQRMPVLALQLRGGPWRKAFDVAAEPLGAGFRRQHAPCFFEKLAAGMIEVVRMLVVAEQHRVDLADLVRAQCRTRQFFQFHMRQLIGAGRVEGGIGEQPEAVDFDERGGAADQGDRCGHDLLP